MESPWITWLVPKANGRRPFKNNTEDTQTQEIPLPSIQLDYWPVGARALPPTPLDGEF